jgi:hypothetical protein
MTNDVDPRLFRKKPTYNEILDLIERDEDKVELPERIGVQFFDSFAMGQYKEMLQESAAGTQAVAEHQAMDAAMTQAATQEEGVSRQELLGFMRDLNAQNTNAHATLAQSLQANIDGHRRQTEQQASSIAQELATHSRRQDERDKIIEELRKSLAANTAPASAPLPTPQVTQEIHTHYHQHQASLQPAVPQTMGSDPQLMQLMQQAQASSDQRLNAQTSVLHEMGSYLGSAIRHMQSQGVGVAQILEHVAQNRQQVADVPASSSSGPPPPPPGAGAAAIADEPRRKKKVVLTPDEALDRLLAKHERKQAKKKTKQRSAPYDDTPRGRGPAEPSGLPPPPPMAIEDRTARPAPTIAPRTPAQKRKAEMQMGRTSKPRQPVVVERFDISEPDQTDHLPPDAEPPTVNFNMGAKIAKSLAQHMSKHKRRTRAVPSAPAAAPLQLEDEARVADEKAFKSAKRAVKKIQKEKQQTVAKPKKTRPAEQQIVSMV